MLEFLRRLPALLCCLAFACSSDSNPDWVCSPGGTVVCFCGDGTSGEQECRADGAGFNPCECSGRGPLDRDLGTEDTAEDVQVEDTADATEEPDAIAEPDAEADTPDADENDAEDTGPDPEDTAEDLGEDPAPDVEEDPADDVVEDPEDAGEPDTEPGATPLGADCETSAECTTGICLGIAVAGIEHSVCTEPCCHEAECPRGFGCLRLGAGRWCLPSRIYPSGFTFTSATGDSCGFGGNACQSGICESSNDMCRGSCCTDSDCGVAPCHWSVTGSSQTMFCDPLGILNGPGGTGDPCFIESDCWNGICVPSPVGGYQCAEPCCSPIDCTFNTTCGLVQGLGGALTKACVPQPPGGLGDGLACSDDGESCAGGHCIDGECRTICCLESNCDAGEACLPAITPEGAVATFCF